MLADILIVMLIYFGDISSISNVFQGYYTNIALMVSIHVN